MVADAVAFEPVSTSEFPANREKNREFFWINWDFGGQCASQFNRLQQDSLINGTGNFFGLAGNFSGMSREFSRSESC